MAESERKLERIPDFRTDDEEAEFWATHSPLDFPEQIEQVKTRAGRPSKSVLAIRLEDEHQRQLREIAGHCGIGPTTLARMFIVSAVNEYRGQGSKNPLVVLGRRAAPLANASEAEYGTPNQRKRLQVNDPIDKTPDSAK